MTLRAGDLLDSWCKYCYPDNFGMASYNLDRLCCWNRKQKGKSGDSFLSGVDIRCRMIDKLIEMSMLDRDAGIFSKYLWRISYSILQDN